MLMSMFLSPSILLLVNFLFILAFFNSAHENEQQSFYDLLGIPLDADLLVIRKAFKRLALQKHPDKNPDDPDAHSTFVRINRAYEVLKDDEMRRKYDQFGEKGLADDFAGANQRQQQYQSWQFYRDNFGIYDEDPEVITLSRAEFHEEVFHSGEIWFVNFYSTFCSHCHQLAPVWRELAKQVPEGVARIGAVNCAEDPGLCQSQRVHGYPSLVVYPKMEFFQGARDVSSLLDFLLSRLPAPVLYPSDDSLPIHRPLLVEFCSSEDCLAENERRKIAMISAQLGISFSVLDCLAEGKTKTFCEESGHQEGLFILSQDQHLKEAKELYFADLLDLRLQLHSYLPDIDEMDADELEWLLQRPPDEENPLTLAILFSDQSQMEMPEWRRLSLHFGSQFTILAVPCHRMAQQCVKIHAGQLPRPVIFRAEGGFDMHYGNIQMDLRQVVKFVRQSAASSLVALNPEKYSEAINSGDLWLIDYFAPWCPPCLRLLAELRKLPKEVHDGRPLRIGTVNCDMHKEICQAQGVNSYPRTTLHGTEDGANHQMVGFHSHDEFIEFIAESLSPSVQSLDSATFEQLVIGRPNGRLYFVDFFAPWCGPCQQLAPEFRRLARQWATNFSPSDGLYELEFATVDCEQNVDLCAQQRINSYPTLRLYRQHHQDPMEYPPNWWRNSQTMAHWLREMMPSRVKKLAGDFGNTVLDSPRPFFVDFYAPWCSHCVQFAPIFEQLANLFHEDDVQFGKVDCERFGWICQTAGVTAFPSLALYFGTDQPGKRQAPNGWTPIQHGNDAEIIAKNIKEILDERPRPMKDEL